MLNVVIKRIMLNVVLEGVAVPRVILLNVIMHSVVRLSVTWVNVVVPWYDASTGFQS